MNVATRRGFIKALPAAALTIPAITHAAEGVSPVQVMFHRWQSATQELEATPDDLSDAESLPLVQRVCALADSIVDVPSQSMADFILKLAAHTDFGQHDLSSCPSSEALAEELRALVEEITA
ncbi:hypothetical protein [Oceanicola sp. S124]|uniref:hypothetical protein n=1 Tax=Oceanicola sp. S124 TaxID=1042378 RepID=UPI000255A954|nr:hypothetical protein [Oceanicola sp. S124]